MKYVLAALALLLAAGRLRAQTVITISFDDIPAFSQVAEQYAAQGLHFLGGSDGVQNGLLNGDSGNWGVDGTNGAFFLGFNGPYSETVNIDNPVDSVAVDVSRTSGSAATDTFTLTAFAGATQVGTQSVTLTTQNVWQTVTISVGSPTITSIQLSGAGISYHPFGVDNLKFVAVPEPSILALLGASLGGIAWLRRRR